MDAYMKEDLASIKLRFKENTIKAIDERAKERIKEEGLKLPASNISHFTYLTGYSEEDLEKKVEAVIAALPDEFFKQTFRKTQVEIASLVADELLNSQYNLRNSNELLDLVEKLFKSSVVEQLTGKPIEGFVKKDNSSLRAQFRMESLALLNNKAKQCIDIATLGKLPESTNYFQYITGHKEWLINKRLDQLIATLPDGFFNMDLEYQTQAKELLVNELFYTRIDINDDEKFLNFVFEFFDKVLNAFKEIAIAGQKTPNKPVLEAPEHLDANSLREQFRTIKDFSDSSPEYNAFATNCKRYISYLQKEGSLLELDDLGKGDLSKRLEYLDKYIKLLQFLSSRIVTMKMSQSSREIQNELILSHNVDSVDNLKDILGKKKDEIEQVLKVAKENEESSIIDMLKGPGGDKLESNGLTKRQAFGLKLFNETYNSRRKLPAAQKQFVQEFLVDSLGNMKLNKALHKADKDFKKLIYKTRDPEIFLRAASKLIAAHGKVNNNEELSEEDKLSLREYGILMSYADTFNNLIYMEVMGLFQDNEWLTNLYGKLKECVPILKEVNKAIEKEAPQEVESGDILLNDIVKEHAFKNKKLDTWHKATLLISEHAHTTKLVREKGEAFVSHIHYAGTSTNPIDIESYLYSNLYKINIAPLINSDVIDRLKANPNYGEDYAKVINVMYRAIETEIHEDTEKNFKGLELRESIEYTKVGIAEFIGPLGHSKLVPESLDRIHADIMAGAKEKNRMLCSEFAARTTVAAFIELNNRLKEELSIKEDVIKIPFTERERFRTMHPDRLLKILGDAGCIESLARTPTERKYLKFSDKVVVDRAKSAQSIRE